MLARAELQTDGTTPLAYLPTDRSTENYMVIYIIWPLTAFLIITSIIVHGSSIAVFTLGKRINTLTLTMSYTQANEDGPSWMNRLPRIQSTAKGSMNKSKEDLSTDSSDEKDFPPGSLGPIGRPGTFLRRQKEEETPTQNGRSTNGRGTTRRKSRWEAGMGPGGPISQSAITPQRRLESQQNTFDSLDEKRTPSSSSEEKDGFADQIEMKAMDRKGPPTKRLVEPEMEFYEEGNHMVAEDEEGNVISVDDMHGASPEQKKQMMLEDEQKLQQDTSGEFAKGKFHPHQKTEGEEIKER
ncbi:MAG: hypothetical protein Q9183_007995, partial [Haloplaca sp. 2 TL-2023]